jgi:ABC-2 type transport system permease protein
LAGIIILVMGFVIGFRLARVSPGCYSRAVGAGVCIGAAWLWIIVGMLMKTPEAVMTMSFVFLMPLTFASDIFVRLETMPGWLQAVVERNPVTVLARASRNLMHWQAAGGDVALVLIWSAAITAVAAPIAFRLYYRER